MILRLLRQLCFFLLLFLLLLLLLLVLLILLTHLPASAAVSQSTLRNWCCCANAANNEYSKCIYSATTRILESIPHCIHLCAVLRARTTEIFRYFVTFVWKHWRTIARALAIAHRVAHWLPTIPFALLCVALQRHSNICAYVCLCMSPVVVVQPNLCPLNFNSQPHPLLSWMCAHCFFFFFCLHSHTFPYVQLQCLLEILIISSPKRTIFVIQLIV